METNEELIELSRNGDEQAISELIYRHKNLVKSIARRYFLIGSDMDDLMQEGMLGLYKAIISYKNNQGSTFSGFAKICISRQVINAIKSANSQKNLILSNSIFLGGQGEIDGGGVNGEEDDNIIVLAYETENPETIALHKEQLKNFYNCINLKLDHSEREILRMYLDGCSYAEMAKKMNETTKKIDNILTKIRNKLKKEVA